MKAAATETLPVGWTVVVDESNKSVNFTAPGDLDKGYRRSDRSFSKALREVFRGKPETISRLTSIQTAFFTAKDRMRSHGPAQLSGTESSTGEHVPPLISSALTVWD
jgi:hypothetical protein